MGGKSQRKGAAGERELAAILQEYGYDCTRGGSLSFGEVPDLSGLPGIHIEVKRVEKLNVVEAMEQSIRDSERMRDGMPTLFHRPKREELPPPKLGRSGGKRPLTPATEADKTRTKTEQKTNKKRVDFRHEQQANNREISL